MAKEKAKLDQSGYTMLHSMANLFISEAKRRVTRNPDYFPGMRAKKFYGFVMSTLPGEAKLKFDPEQKLWNPIFNLTMETVENRDCDEGVERYMSM